MFNRSRPQLRVCARPVHIGLLAALLAAAALSLETQSSEAVTDGTPGSNHRQAFAENAAYEIPHTGSANSTATFSTGVPTSTGFTVRRGETTYHADSSVSSYTGSLKSVVESAADDLNARGGGTIAFEAGDFDLGGDWFELTNLQDIVFQGQGIDVTFLRNFTSVSTDTEPFDFSWSDRITIRDFTISAGGPPRNSSDAIDFDGGDANLIERVKITSSRGDGIIFDGKDLGQTADGNIVRNCILTDIPRDGIQFLASSHNVVENCQIIDVGAVGIRIHRASAVAAQPNKASNDNVLTGNLIRNAGEYGIRINGGERNLVSDNTILNSSDDRPNRDAVRINDAAPCRDNIVRFNTATDTQTPKVEIVPVVRAPQELPQERVFASRRVAGRDDYQGEDQHQRDRQQPGGERVPRVDADWSEHHENDDRAEEEETCLLHEEPHPNGGARRVEPLRGLPATAPGYGCVIGRRPRSARASGDVFDDRRDAIEARRNRSPRACSSCAGAGLGPNGHPRRRRFRGALPWAAVTPPSALPAAP